MAAGLHDELVKKLTALGQRHLFAFYGELSAEQQGAFDRQLAGLDWELIHRLIETMVKDPKPFALPGDVKPAPSFEHAPKDEAKKKRLAEARARGEQLLREGKVAAFVVAGGQGSRLGWEGPKGTFPATAIRQKTLFQLFAEFLLELEKRFGKAVPFYLMTSPQNDAPTREFWEKNKFFGMKRENVMFFPQDSLPAIGFDGKVLLEAKDSLALSPNGHGGSLLALYKSGATADMATRGVTQISYFQVDNPIVRCVDPLFIGLHDLEGAQMSSKMLPKTGPKEKLGNLVLMGEGGGKMGVIEYSDLPEELANQRDEKGELRFRAGSIALHALRRDFVEELNRHGFALPFHRAEKKVPCMDLGTGEEVSPAKPNAVKLETFVFDALPLATKSIVYETDRIDEFAPIKNAEGVDSAQSSKEISTERNARWVEAAGVAVPRKADGKPDCVIELAASFAIYPEDVAVKKSKLPEIKAGGQMYLE